VTPTNAKPDMSSLRLVKESELRRGGIIGSGAFGTVYKVSHTTFCLIFLAAFCLLCTSQVMST